MHFRWYASEIAVIPLLLELSFLLDIGGIGMAMFIEQYTIIDSVT